jgi:hypothetical protein
VSAIDSLPAGFAMSLEAFDRAEFDGARHALQAQGLKQPPQAVGDSAVYEHVKSHVPRHIGLDERCARCRPSVPGAVAGLVLGVAGVFTMLFLLYHIFHILKLALNQAVRKTTIKLTVPSPQRREQQ